MWVAQFSLEIELEIVVIFHLLIAQFNNHCSSTFDHCTRHHRFKNCIDGLAQIFDHDGLSIAHCKFQEIDVFILSLLNHLHFLEFGTGLRRLAILILRDHRLHQPCVALLDPFDPLELGINHQRPSCAVGNDGPVLNGNTVRWQALSIPSSNSGRVAKQVQWLQSFGHRDFAFGKIGYPQLINELIAKPHIESTNVAYERRRCHDIADEIAFFDAKLFNRLSPTNLLISKSIHKSV
mmetsp:Transcript_88795/g.236358  ORF Transcript_88795/g.236358 Transcript_88795/m.236358 type:complete len:236 (+) Transcript_88795:3089-3796(+)